jgi:thiamine transport system permease protein
VLAFAVASGEASARRGGSRWAARIAVCGVTPIRLSPMALALGFYLLFRNLGDSRGISLLGIALTNALLSTPFLVATLRPAIELAGERHHHLCSALGIAGLRRWRIVDWPTLRGAIATAAALGLAFSLGDLVAVSLYGDPAIRTLSLLLYDQLSAYRMAGAAATALFLMLVVFISYRALERVIGGRHAT